MVRWLLLVVTSILLVLGLFTVIKTPNWLPWEGALLAGEYGHWLALLALGLLLALRFARPPRGWSIAIASIAVLATGLLLKPCAQAWAISRALPGTFTRGFPTAPTGGRAPFSPARFLSRKPAPVPVQTFRFSGELALDFYRPISGKNQPTPCVIALHGGGWDEGDRGEFPWVNHALAQRGYAVAAMSYRLAPRFPWPAPREDALAAIAYLKAHARDLNIDPTRLVLFGRSAGAQIAEVVAFTAADPAIRGLIALYAPADFEFAWTYIHENDPLGPRMLIRQYLGGELGPATREAFRSASGYMQVTRQAPPTLLMHGRLDTIVAHRQTERLAERLTAEHVPHVFVSLPWATHAFEYNLSGPGGQIALWSIEEFLAVVTR